jgi:hypothetical protein
MAIFEDASKKVLTGQVIFAALLTNDMELDAQFREQQKRISNASQSVKGAVDKM